jgi:acetyl-CoA/propionyl-CoA carboxylase biotin carboxyl carrier protein
MFAKVIIANRGEIAVRIMGTLRGLGIASVAVFTDVDRDALHVAAADEAVALGPANAYLDVDRIVAAALSSGADALHPGYGFLSENERLARACEAAGVVFVGPPAGAMAAMGDKIRAKQTVAAAGVPVVPGRNEAGLSDEQLAEAALEIGLPVLIKPSAGGGGKGMRRVDEPAALADSLAAARREARSAFGDDTLLVERFVTRPRHIEVQIFADAHGRAASLGERECSLQRRHQKIVEEAPSVLLDAATRAEMGASAVAAARACGYVGAGTVEFIVSSDRPDEYFFMEMNTRLQVEHPVTEAVLGLDLVEWQLRVAAGEPIPWDGLGPPVRGHAVEARVYAEDPQRGFLPATGTVLRLEQPDDRPHIRVDSALRPGTVVGTDYDPMLAKVVAWGVDRATALSRLHEALAATEVLGVTTNVGFLARLVDHPEVRAGRLDTELVGRLAGQLAGEAAPQGVVDAAARLELLARASAGGVVDPWTVVDGWRLAGPAPVHSRWHVGGETVEAEITPGGDDRLVGDDLVVGGTHGPVRYSWVIDGDVTWLGRGGDAWMLRPERETIDRTGVGVGGSGPLTSPMPGTVLAVHVAVGETVSTGQPLMVVEAMKMEHVIAASADGEVAELLVKAGDRVALDQPLAVIDSGEEGGA